MTKMWVSISITAIISTFFSVSDILFKKIPNISIIITILTGICINIYLYNENIAPFIINIISAAILGFALFYFKIWKAGDGKLLIAFSAVMPPIKVIDFIPLPVILTTTAFIAGFILLLPSLLFHTSNALLKDEKQRMNFIINLTEQLLIITGTVWVIKIPLQTVFSNNLLLYFVAYRAMSFVRSIWIGRQKKLFLWSVGIIGIILLFAFSIFIPALHPIRYIKITTFYTSIYTIIDLSVKYLPQHKTQQRIAFAPLLGIAALLVFSPNILRSFLQIIRRI